MARKRPLKRPQPCKITAEAKDINKENDPQQLQSMISNKRVLRKRPQKQVSMKEESSAEDSSAEKSSAEESSDEDSESKTKKDKKPSNKSRALPQRKGKAPKIKPPKSKQVQSESDSDSEEATKSKIKIEEGTSHEVIPPIKPSQLVSVKEEASASESEDDMVDVFTKKESVEEKVITTDDYRDQGVQQNTTPTKNSEVGDVMDMLMACESSTAKDKNDSDSEGDWEQVKTAAKLSPEKKSAKTRQRKRKITENSDPDFEASSKKKIKKSEAQPEAKSRKRKKNTVKSEDEEAKPKKVKTEQLTDAEKEIRRFTNRCLKDRDSCLEQCSLVLGVAFLQNITRCTRKPLFQGLLLSLVPEKHHDAKKKLEQFLTTLLDWYRNHFRLQQNEDTKTVKDTCSHSFMKFITSLETTHEHVYAAGFCALLQVLGIETRFVGSIYVPSLEKVAKSTKLSSKAYPNPSYWVEVKDGDKIIAIDVVNGLVTEDAFVESKYVNPQGYVVSITPSLIILDSTPKYVEKWSEIHRKARMLNYEFWDSFVADQPTHWVTLREHSSLMKEVMIARGFPKSLGGFKHNLVFALEKDNLKIEAIYPKDAPVLGTFKGHNVFSRDNVRSLKQIIVIKKEGRALKEGEVPYKMVKNKILYDRWPGDDRWKDLPLYGDWQTEWYKAPTAQNGVVPRNEFGNVELFKPWMLPKKSVHVDLPGSYALARRLKIDAAHACTGFEFPRCRAVPVMSGVVVCEEYAETLRNAWVEYSAIQSQKAEVNCD